MKSENESGKRFRLDPGRFFLGLVVLALGAAYLFRNLGYINFNLDWQQLWPLLLIFFGLSLLSGRSLLAWLLGVIITLIVIIILFLSVGLDGRVSRGNNFFSREKGAITNDFQEDLSFDKDSNVEQVDLVIKMGAGNLNLTGGTDKLLEGKFNSSLSNLETESTTTNKKQTIIISANRFVGLGKRPNDLNLKLNESTPLSLNLETGAMKMDLDLSEVMAKAVDIDTGATELKLKMGSKLPQSQVKIDAGATSVNLELPRATGAKLKMDSGLSSRNLEGFIQVDSNNYKSENYDAAEKKVDVDLDLGASSLNVSRY